MTLESLPELADGTAPLQRCVLRDHARLHCLFHVLQTLQISASPSSTGAASGHIAGEPGAQPHSAFGLPLTLASKIPQHPGVLAPTYAAVSLSLPKVRAFSLDCWKRPCPIFEAVSMNLRLMASVAVREVDVNRDCRSVIRRFLHPGTAPCTARPCSAAAHGLTWLAALSAAACALHTTICGTP